MLKIAGTKISALYCVYALCVPAYAEDIVPPKIYSVTPPGVSLADGSFTFTDTDLSIGPLVLQRYHLGGRRDPNDPPFGPRMGHNFDIFLARNIHTDCAEQGCLTYYTPIVHMGTTASGSFYESRPPNVIINHDDLDSLKGELTKDASGFYHYIDQDGTEYVFGNTAVDGVPNAIRVAYIIFSNGRRQDFTYSGTQLKVVNDSSGYALVFDYENGGHVSSVCGYNTSVAYVSASSNCSSSQIKSNYSYVDNKLSAVTDAAGIQTSYTYTGAEIACVSRPALGGCKITNTYGSSSYGWQVTRQDLADGSIWQYSYSGDYLKARNPDEYADVEPSNGVIVTNPLGKTSSYSFVSTSPYSSTDENGNSTSYRFSGGVGFRAPSGYATNYGSLLIESTLPGGNKYNAVYGNKNVIASQTWTTPSGDAVRSVSYGYPNSCSAPYTPQNCTKPLWIRDAKSNQTDYSYSTFGAPLWEMQPAPTPGAPRPLKIHTYVQKFAYVRDPGGNLTPAASAIWMPSTETVCQTGAGSADAVCDPAAQQSTTTYEYGADGTADNLLVRGKVVTADGVNRRTCFRYDQQGNQISATGARAGLGSCS